MGGENSKERVPRGPMGGGQPIVIPGGGGGGYGGTGGTYGSGGSSVQSGGSPGTSAETNMTTIKKNTLLAPTQSSGGGYGTTGGEGGPAAVGGGQAKFYVCHKVSEQDTVAGLCLRYRLEERPFSRYNRLSQLDPSVQHLSYATLPVNKANTKTISDWKAPEATEDKKRKRTEGIKEIDRIAKDAKVRVAGEVSDLGDEEDAYDCDSILCRQTHLVLKQFALPDFSDRVVLYNNITGWQMVSIPLLSETYVVQGESFAALSKAITKDGKKSPNALIILEEGNNGLPLLIPITEPESVSGAMRTACPSTENAPLTRPPSSR